MSTAALRQITVLALRLAGIIFIFVGILLLPKLVLAIANAWRAGSQYIGAHLVAGGGILEAGLSMLILLGIGAALCIFSGRLTHWLVPIPGTRCLRCGHKLDPANRGTCPECSAESA